MKRVKEKEPIEAYVIEIVTVDMRGLILLGLSEKCSERLPESPVRWMKSRAFMQQFSLLIIGEGINSQGC